MQNRIISTLIIFMIAVMSLPAQTYTVYSVIGNVKIVQGENALPLEPRKQLNVKNRLLIGAESAVTLLDEKNRKMYSFSTEGTHSVDDLVTKANNKSKSVSKQYMSYLIKQLFSNGSSKMSHPDTYMQVTATSYRSATNDSMLLSRIAQSIPLELGTLVEQQLCLDTNSLKSDLDVRFELVSCDTGFPLENRVKGNTGCYVRVHNNTEEALYVNVLDIDEKGGKYLVLPVDEAATCAHLLVPAMSSVSFKSEPFIFSEEPLQETFILVATQDPVDFSILMNPIRSSGSKPMKSGLFRNIYHVLP